MRLLLNTSGAIAGGALTHLRNLLPAMERQLAAGDRVLVVGSAWMREAIRPPEAFEWIEVDVDFARFSRRLWWENTELPRIVAASKPDVVFHPANVALYRCPVPHVTLVHNLAPFLPEIIAEESNFQRFRLSLLKTLTIDSLRRAEQTLFVSKWGRERVREAARATGPVQPVVYFGSEHGAAEPREEHLAAFGLEPGRFILSVSHFYRYKRLLELVEAYSMLGEAAENMPLVLAGEPYDVVYTAELREAAARARGEVIFTGGLAADAVATLLQRCGVFVFTSAVENLPISLLEALRAGAPIVTSRVCSMPEVCEEAALYVDPPDAAGYAEKLGQLLASESEREALRARARKRGEFFSWSRAASETLDILRQVARGAA